MNSPLACAWVMAGFVVAVGALGVPTARAQINPLNPAINCSVPPTFDPASPAFLAGDIGINGPQQIDVDCFAWQSFIALNWPVSSAWPGDPSQAGEPDRTVKAASWGTPQDPTKVQLRPTAWQTFKSVPDIFVAQGKTPTGWGIFPPPPAACTGANVAALGPEIRPRWVLSAINKLQVMPKSRLAALLGGGSAALNPDDIMQAFGGWLTDQQQNLVWYERAVNRQEFQYLLSPDNTSADALYTRGGQQTVATNSNGKHPNGLSFPFGMPPMGNVQTWSQLGAVEIKAAWRILTALPTLWPRYLLSQAYLVDPQTGKCTQAILGLVGLHIIRNTATFPNFAWSTFEHIDNAPQSPSLYPDPYTHPNGYSFFNPNCTQNCTPNQPRIDGNGKPLFPMNQPVQVARTFPIATQLAQLNLGVQQQIARNNPQSVFQYYQLVNVLWDQSPTLPITAPNQTTPLNISSMTSEGPNSPVANTTLETYAQTRSCVSCHARATIAGSTTLAADFSFAFLETQASTAELRRAAQLEQRRIKDAGKTRP